MNMSRVDPNRMMQAFEQFRRNFSGDPRQTVMQLVRSGRMSQEQLNRLQNMANMFHRMMGPY